MQVEVSPMPAPPRVVTPKSLPPGKRRTWFVIAYVAAVLLIDTLATTPTPLPGLKASDIGVASTIADALNHVLPAPISSLRWHPRDVAGWLTHTPLPAWTYAWLEAKVLANVDVFKLIFWFIVPVLLCGRRIDLKAFGFSRWRKLDWRLFAIAAVLGFLAVCLVPLIPQLRAYYGSGTGGAFSAKLFVVTAQLLWTLSWLPGWEFMHRYFLLNAVSPRWRFGWLLVPFLEWAYHLQKVWIEGLGMLLFSILATQYVLRRRNLSLPFAVHLLIEIALPLTLLFSALNPLTWALAGR